MSTEVTVVGGYTDVSFSGEVVDVSSEGAIINASIPAAIVIVNRISASVIINIESPAAIIPGIVVSALFSRQQFYSFDLQQRFSASANRPLPEHNIKRFA